MATSEKITEEVIEGEGTVYTPSLHTLDRSAVYSGLYYYNSKIYAPFGHYAYYPEQENSHRIYVSKKESGTWTVIAGPEILAVDDWTGSGSPIYPDRRFVGLSKFNLTSVQKDNKLYIFYVSTLLFTSPDGPASGALACVIFNMDDNTFSAEINSGAVGYFVWYNLITPGYRYIEELVVAGDLKLQKIVAALRDNGEIFVAWDGSISETGFLEANKQRLSWAIFSTSTDTFGTVSIYGTGSQTQDYRIEACILGVNDNIHLIHYDLGSAGSTIKQLVFNVANTVVLTSGWTSFTLNNTYGYHHSYIAPNGDKHVTFTLQSGSAANKRWDYFIYNLTTLTSETSESIIITHSSLLNKTGISVNSMFGLITVDIVSEHQAFVMGRDGTGQLVIFRLCIGEGGLPIWDPIHLFTSTSPFAFDTSPIPFQIFAKRKDSTTLGILVCNRNPHYDFFFTEPYRIQLHYLELAIAKPCSLTTSPLDFDDTLLLNDAINLRLDGSSLPNVIVLDKCPVNIINSPFCAGFKEGQIGTEDPLACPPKFFEISKEQCP